MAAGHPLSWRRCLGKRFRDRSNETPQGNLPDGRIADHCQMGLSGGTTETDLAIGVDVSLYHTLYLNFRADAVGVMGSYCCT